MKPLPNGTKFLQLTMTLSNGTTGSPNGSSVDVGGISISATGSPSCIWAGDINVDYESVKQDQLLQTSNFDGID